MLFTCIKFWFFNSSRNVYIVSLTITTFADIVASIFSQTNCRKINFFLAKSRMESISVVINSYDAECKNYSTQIYVKKNRKRNDD